MSAGPLLDDLAGPLPSGLPPVERRAVMPAGFAAGATTCGIKASGRPDLAIVMATVGAASAAAIFTTNLVAAAPVQASQTNLAVTRPEGRGDGSAHYGRARAVVATSGCANAATGLAGLADQAAIGRAAAARLGVDPFEVLALSTGLIGSRLPVERVTAGIAGLAAGGLSGDGAGLLAAAEALRTTDTTTKVASATVALSGPDGTARTARVSGIAKGVGMIHPRMATMLAVVLTDAAAPPATLHAILRRAAVRTWNQLSVDGDTSTNDTVFLLASGASAAAVEAGSPAEEILGGAVEAVARSLAMQQAADGEGATTLLVCAVTGARDDVDARAVARAVVSSSLVKAAVHGRDPNWGRVAGAAGNARLGEPRLLEMAGLSREEACARAGSPAFLDPGRLRIAIAGHLVHDGAAGAPVPFDRGAVRAAMDAPEVLLRLDLGLGGGRGEAFGCDLSEQYVIENAEYST